MRHLCAIACLMASAALYAAELEPETTGNATLGDPSPHWFITLDPTGAYVFDGDTGDMLGKLTISDYTSVVSVDKARGMIYVPGTFYTRRTYGERTDVVAFNRIDTLAPVAEVSVPKKIAAAGNGGTTDLIGGRFLGVYNMTPAMSVSIVDVEQKKFVQEIATAGCALVYPVPAKSAFMQICGDGALQLVTLDGAGKEANRTRSSQFFDVDKDPLYDVAARTDTGWILASFSGQVYEASFANGIAIGTPWSLYTDKDREERWQLGGRQPLAYNAPHHLLFALVHEGKADVDTHEDDGTEIWAYDVRTQRRGYRIRIEDKIATMNVTADEKPLLIVVPRKPRTVLVYDARTGRLLRTIEEAGFAPGLVQRF